jgi:hypothetical protein
MKNKLKKGLIGLLIVVALLSAGSFASKVFQPAYTNSHVVYSYYTPKGTDINHNG